MSTSAGSSRVALVAERDGPDASRLTALLTPEELARTSWFAPEHLADLDREVQGAQVRRVIFRSAADLLDGIWDGEVELNQWIRTGVQIDFADSPPFAIGWEGLLKVHHSWELWNRRHRRRQAVAGAILSTIVIVTCFLLNMVWPAHVF